MAKSAWGLAREKVAEVGGSGRRKP
jgi:hypothetical protein